MLVPPLGTIPHIFQKRYHQEVSPTQVIFFAALGIAVKKPVSDVAKMHDFTSPLIWGRKTMDFESFHPKTREVGDSQRGTISPQINHHDKTFIF